MQQEVMVIAFGPNLRRLKNQVLSLTHPGHVCEWMGGVRLSVAQAYRGTTTTQAPVGARKADVAYHAGATHPLPLEAQWPVPVPVPT